jgi:D-sedoheptulose 7-phosphate isomerase
MTLFLDGYRSRLDETIRAIDTEALKRVAEAIESAARSGGHIYTIGNGGSAAIADHLCCDWTKSTDVDGLTPIISHSLASNMPLYSAIANDFGFDEVFARQVAYFGRPGDVLIAISSSGESANVVLGAKAAKAAGMKVIGLTGFSGGKLREIADIALHAPVKNYGIVEDVHQSLMHMIAQFLTARRLNQST